MSNWKNAYTVAADGGEDIVVAGVDEVETNGVERALPLSVLTAELVLPLPARRQRPHRRLAPQPLHWDQPRHGLLLLFTLHLTAQGGRVVGMGAREAAGLWAGGVGNSGTLARSGDLEEE